MAKKAKLTRPQVINIIQQRGGPHGSRTRLAARLGVTPASISAIQLGKQWKSVWHQLCRKEGIAQ